MYITKLYNCTKKQTVNGKILYHIIGVCYCNKVNGLPWPVGGGNSLFVKFGQFCKFYKFCTNSNKDTKRIPFAFYTIHIPVLSHGTIGGICSLLLMVKY